MDRLVVLHLEAVGCTAEAWLNGVPLARVEGKTAEAAPGVSPIALASSKLPENSSATSEARAPER